MKLVVFMKKLKEERTVLLRGIFKKKGKLKNKNKKNHSASEHFCQVGKNSAG